MSTSSMDGTESVDRAALAGMLKGYNADQLVEEVLSAWDELSTKNGEIASVKQRNRVLELDLAEREDVGAPEKARLSRLDEEVRDKEARIIHLERMLNDARGENDALATSVDMTRMESMESENARLNAICEDQGNVIAEMEGKMDQLVDALEKAAEAGLTSITADEVRMLNKELEDTHRRIESGDAEREALESERERLREMVEQVRGLLEQRDLRIKEMEAQMQRVMEGPRSISAEHDYLVEQIEEMKRRLLERNREYESLRRRERRLHTDVFERDERIQQMSLTITDLEAALTDRVAEIRELESQNDIAMEEVNSVRRGERTREVVGRVFADSLSLVRGHDAREAKRDAYANSPDVERSLSSPNADDMRHLAEGGTVDLTVEESELPQGMDVDEKRPPSPGGSGDPVLFDEESEDVDE